jgi:hypothetical protein
VSLPVRFPASRRGLWTALVALGVLVPVLLAAPAADAATGVVIPLDPPEVMVSLYPVENTGPLTIQDAQDDRQPAGTPVAVQWGGAVTVQLPAHLDGSGMTVSLDLAPTADDSPTRSLASDATAPDTLVVTDLGGGKFRIDLPADDSTDGPVGLLSIGSVTSSDAGILVPDMLQYELGFRAGADPVVALSPQVLAVATVPCALTSTKPCPPFRVTAGATIGLTVPARSRLRELGLGTLDGLRLGLVPLDAHGDPTGGALIDLTDRPGNVSVADSYHATVRLPADTRAGTYGLVLVQATGTSGSLSITVGELRVLAAPVPRVTPVRRMAPVRAVPAVNVGLRSETGWDRVSAARSETGGAPLIPVGAGMVLLGAGGVAALRPRRPADRSR